MQEIHVTVNENGRVVIPSAVRKALGIEPGDELVLRVIEPGTMEMTTLQGRLQAARELVRRYVDPGVSLADELIAERREAARHA